MTPSPGDQPLSRRELRERERAAAAAAAAAAERAGAVQPQTAAEPAAAVVSSFAPEAPRAYAPSAPADPVTGPVAEVDESTIDRPTTRRELRALREAEERAARAERSPRGELPPRVEPVETPLDPPRVEPVETPPRSPYEEWQRRMGLRAAEQGAAPTTGAAAGGLFSAPVPSPPASPRAEAPVPDSAPAAPMWPSAPVTPVEPARAVGPEVSAEAELLVDHDHPISASRHIDSAGLVDPDHVFDSVEHAAVAPSTAAQSTVAPHPGPQVPDEFTSPAEDAPAAERGMESRANMLAGEHAMPLLKPAPPAPPTDPWARQTELDQAVDTGAVSIASREFGASPVITNALVIQPPTADAPMSPKGDILATGSIQLPPHFAQSGFASPVYDTGEDDHLFDADDSPLSNTDAQPVRAANAVSIHTESGGSLSLVPQRSNRGIVALIVIAGSMAVLVAGTLVVAIMTGQL